MVEKTLLAPYDKLLFNIGNYDCFLWSFPAFIVKNDGMIHTYCATNVDWAFDEEKKKNVENLLEPMDANDFEESVHKAFEHHGFEIYKPIQPKEPILIDSGQIIAHMGQRFDKELAMIYESANIPIELQNWTEVQYGCRFKCMQYPEYQKLQESIAKIAQNVFDSEVKMAKGMVITPRAHHASKQLWSLSSQEDKFVRYAAYALIEEDLVEYQLLLRLNEIGMKKPIEELDILAYKWCEETFGRLRI